MIKIDIDSVPEEVKEDFQRLIDTYAGTGVNYLEFHEPFENSAEFITHSFDEDFEEKLSQVGVENTVSFDNTDVDDGIYYYKKGSAPFGEWFYEQGYCDKEVIILLN